MKSLGFAELVLSCFLAAIKFSKLVTKRILGNDYAVVCKKNETSSACFKGKKDFADLLAWSVVSKYSI